MRCLLSTSCGKRATHVRKGHKAHRLVRGFLPNSQMHISAHAHDRHTSGSLKAHSCEHSVPGTYLLLLSDAPCRTMAKQTAAQQAALEKARASKAAKAAVMQKPAAARQALSSRYLLRAVLSRRNMHVMGSWSLYDAGRFMHPTHTHTHVM